MAYQPKNYKKFVATAATATLVATAIAPAAFADQASTSAFTDVGDRYTDAVDYVVSGGIAIGITPTQFGVSASITRGDAAIMIATAAGLMNEKAPASGFSDVPKRGAVAVNSLKEAGIINGVSATKFGWDQTITRGQAAFMLAQAYDLKDGDVSKLNFTDVGSKHRFATEVASLVENKITDGETATKFGIESSIKRGDFAIFLHRLHELTKAPMAPTVSSVTGLNTNQVQVNFNTTLNADDKVAKDATEVANYKLGSATPTKAELSTDKRSVVLTFASSVEGKDQVLVVEPTATNVKDTDGKWVNTEKFSGVFTYTDTVKPVITSTVYENGKITLTFSEDLGTAPTVIRVNGEPVTGATTGNKVVITKSLNASQTASLYVAGATDNAAVKNEMVIYNGSVTAPSADMEKPRVTSVQVVDQKTAKVTLSEDIVEDNVSVKLQQGGTQTTATLVRDTTDTTGKTYLLNVGELFPAGSTATSQTFTLYAEAGVMTDLAANKNEFYSTSVTFAKDLTAPTLSSTRVSAENEKLEFTFNEKLVVAGSDSQITIRNSQGVNFTAVDAESMLKTDDASTYLVDFKSTTAALDAGTYTVTFPAGFFTDVQGNKSAAVSSTITVPGTPAAVDNVKPTASVVTTGTNEFTVSYSEEVAANGISLSSYRLDGQALPAGTDIYFTGTDKMTAVIKLPAGSVNIGNQTAGTPAVLTVLNTTDKAGNVIVTANSEVTIKDNTPAKITSVQTAGDIVAVTFNEAISIPANVDANDVFDVKMGNTVLDANDLTLVVGNDNQVRFKLATAPTGTVSATVKAGQNELVDRNGVLVK
ncbi:S-layer homology domain-containing protein [Planococcus sp. ANT_H30]|uniref:S-layer homology domain-containing protein n=1 Tax=Planococcus sp. ANT_H30 TaxID=2597347 RepID=UPI0011EEA726|nr:S-layer homology domain-containing protein [Planococcus sp. ANT_H30]KAA0958784.1 S-layer homology domain-containing protein [Planococcus sp. ANT_H30]